MNKLKNLYLAVSGATFITLGIATNATAVNLYNITDLGLWNHNDYQLSFDYKGDLVPNGRKINSQGNFVDGEYIYYADGTQEYLGTLAPPGLEDVLPTTASAINEQNQVVGNSFYADAFIWTPESGISQIDIPVGGGIQSAYDINNQGQIIGYAGETNSGYGYVMNSDGTATLLTPLPGFDEPRGTVGRGINDLGQVVGTFITFDSLLGQAILYEDGTLYNLNDLIASPTNTWILDEAYDINNQGQIYGRGYLNGELQAFLATPVVETEPVPESNSVNGLLAFSAIATTVCLLQRQSKSKQKVT